MLFWTEKQIQNPLQITSSYKKSLKNVNRKNVSTESCRYGDDTLSRLDALE